MRARSAGPAVGEWRRYWMVPLVGAIGYSAGGLQIYATGVFVVPLEEAFGWSRAQALSGLTIAGLVGIALNFFVGLAVDRLGPRVVGTIGLILTCGGFALVATATGEMLNWWLLWSVVAVGNAFASAIVWTSPVAARFDRSRGFAIAVTLTGSSITGALAPLLAATLLGLYGWRVALAGTGLIWLTVTLPVVLIFLPRRRPTLEPRKTAKYTGVDLAGLTLSEALRKPAFWRIAVANTSFGFYTMALSPNLIALLAEKGTTIAVAAQLASAIGIVGLIARLSAGVLLDRLPPNLVATAIFILPVAGCALLLFDAPSYLVLTMAVVALGATIGAEYDVVFYMTSRHFGLKSFGSLLGLLLTFSAVGAALSPLIAGSLHDASGDYHSLLILLMALMSLSTVAMATMGKPPYDRNLEH